jgi:hypothetical protein
VAHRWEFDESAHRFRETAAGRFLSANAAVDLRDGFQERRQADVDTLARQLANEDITVQAWEAAMRDTIRDTFAAQYAYGRGGLNAMTAGDWQAINDLADAQAEYLRAFAEDVAAGRLSEAQIGARADLYLASSRHAYGRGLAASWGIDLPAYPGDGSSECKSNDRCHWEIEDVGDEIHATWKLSSAEHCATCRSRASVWAPLVFEKPDDGRIARLYRAA